jgi:hypothetical protein
MNALLSDPEGLALALVMSLLGIVFLIVAAVVEHRHKRRARWNVERVDLPRCERPGSQDEFSRRLRAGGAR